MSMNQLMQALAALPQFMESLKKMTPEEKKSLIGQLGLKGQEEEVALRILQAFQEGKPLNPGDQAVAMGLLEKALQKTDLDLATILKMKQG